MPPKSTQVKSTKAVTETKPKATKRVVKKEETSESESGSESEHEVEQPVQVVKKTTEETKKKSVAKKPVKKLEQEPEPESESEEEQDNKEVKLTTKIESEWANQLSDQDDQEEHQEKQHNEPQEDQQEEHHIEQQQEKPQSFSKSNRFSGNNGKPNNRYAQREQREYKPREPREYKPREPREGHQRREYKPRYEHKNQSVQNTTEEPQSVQGVQEAKTEDNRPRTSARYNMKTGNRVSVNKTSMALKFSYNDYDNVGNPVMEVSTEDLLKVLIARSFKEGQMTLKRSLECVLRAMNHECNFPMSD